MHHHRILLFVVLLAGCTTSRAVRVTGPGMNSKREAGLRALASKPLDCFETLIAGEFIESLERNVHLYRATGCGRSHEALLACAPTVGCTWIDTPDTRAAFDLQCPKEKLSRTYLGSGTFGVAGCGRTITYVWANGRFVANNSSTGLAPQTPPPQASPNASSL